MAEINTTSINDLPTDPSAGGSLGGNISLEISQKPSQLTLDQSTISQIVNGLQQATITGSTQLPSRDIPMTSTNITHDPQVQPNYIPMHERQMDYIKNYEDNSNIVDNYNKHEQYNSSIDDMYNEIQTPLLMAVLYFLFQLPFFKKFLFGYFPALFSKDGNLNLYGFVFNSILLFM